MGDKNDEIIGGEDEKTRRVDDIIEKGYTEQSSAGKKITPTAQRPSIASSTHTPPVTRKDFYTQATGKPMPRKVISDAVKLDTSTETTVQRKPISTTSENGRRVIFDASETSNVPTPKPVVVKKADDGKNVDNTNSINERKPKKPADNLFIDADKEKKAKKEESANSLEKKLDIVSVVLFILAAVLLISSVVYMFIGRNRSTVQEAVKPKEQPIQMTEYKFKSPISTDKHYNVKFPDGIQDKYKALYAQNQDFVGWLSIPNTCIDMPVYKTDNDSYYLKHDNFDEYTKYGVPFLDCDDGVEELSRNSTIYGHNFDNKLIFDEIHNYEDLEFYKANPVITFNTLYKDYKWKVIACFRTNGDSSGDNGYLFYYIAPNMSDSNFMSYYNSMMERSYLQTQKSVQVIPNDKILTLSTCTYFFDRNGSLENARFVLVAKMIRENESESVDVSQTTLKKDVRYPQLYYDVFGGENPYRDSFRWEPSMAE